VLPFARIKVKVVARRDAAPTTHCQIGLRFSAVQPPSELISSYPSTQSSYYCTHPSLAFDLWPERQIGSSKLSVHTYCSSLLQYFEPPSTHDPVKPHLRRKPRRRPTKLTAYDSTTCSRRADTTQELNTNRQRQPCAIPFKSSHCAQRQSPPSSSQTCNHSSPPFPYQSPTTSHPPPSQIGLHLKSKRTTHPHKNQNNKLNHTSTSSAAKTTTPAHRATTTARTLVLQVSAARLAQGAVQMQRDMSLVAQEERLARARSERSIRAQQRAHQLALAVRHRLLRGPQTLDCL
jgi:hypothetical protein